MYAQKEKPAENKSRAVANSVAQKKTNGQQGVGFVDNRPEAISQRNLESLRKNNVFQYYNLAGVSQFKGGKKEGTFIGDESAIHLHIDIGNPHLMVGGDRYDIKGNDFGGSYSKSRLVNALEGLTKEDKSGVSGAVACRAWLEGWLDGETIPANVPNSSVSEASWGKGLIISYPSRPFKKG